MIFLLKFLLKMMRKIIRIIYKHMLWFLFIMGGFLMFSKFVSHGKSDVETVQQDGESMPIISWWTYGFPGSIGITNCKDNLNCKLFSNRTVLHGNVDAYLFYASNIKFDDLPLPRKPEKIIWGLYHEESPRNVEEFSHEAALKIFNFSSTFSRYSDVSFPLQYLGTVDEITSTKYYVPTDIKNSYKDLSPILYIQTDCETTTERDVYVKELMKYIDIDSYGACLKNKELPTKFTIDYLEHLDDDDFLKFVARYKFVLALENGVCYDYLTEKFWRAIKVGTVPIYFGAPNIGDWLPNKKSAILLEDHPTPKLMSDYIKKLLANDSLYEEYLEHKTKNIVTNLRLIDELKRKAYQKDALRVVEHFECYVCQKIYERRQGSKEISIVNKSHYNCPKPISALTLQVNPNNDWVFSWGEAKKRAEKIERLVLGLG